MLSRSEGERAPIVVVGGGIAGLAAAFALHRERVPFLLLEASSRVGGAIRSVRDGPYLVELGANTVQATEEIVALARDVGLAGELLEADPRLPRFVFHGGTLHAVPMGPIALATTSLLSAQGKAKVLAEPFVPVRRDPAPESVASFVERRFGREVLERMVAPFVSGTYAGDPERLEIGSVFPRLVALEREHGSVVRGALFGRRDPAAPAGPRKVVSFRGGLESLCRAVAERLGPAVRTGTAVESLRHRAGGGFEVRLAGGATIEAAGVILALDPWSAAGILREESPDLALELEGISAPPLALAAVALRRDRIAHDLRGFGFLAAARSGLGILGAIFASSVFAERAPAGEALLVAFVGGAIDPAAASLDDAEIVRRVVADLRRVVGASAEPVWSRVERYPRAIAQYAIGHAERVARIRTALERLPGLELAGNYFAGISVGEALRSGLTASAAVLGSCRTSPSPNSRVQAANSSMMPSGSRK